MPSAIQNKTKVCDIGQMSGLAVLFGLWMLGAAIPSYCAEFAPIRLGYSVGGNLDYLLQYNRVNNVPYMEQVYGLTVTTGVRAETFIWQPWLLKVGSNVGLSIGNRLQDKSARGSLNMVRTGEAKYRSIEGGVDFKLLSQSRFPFIAKFIRKDSRREVGLLSVASKELLEQLDFTQSYRTPRGNASIWANYKRDRRENELSQVGHLESRRIEAALLLSAGQTLSVTSVKTNEDSEILGRSLLADTLSAQHAYRDGELTLGTMAISQDLRPGSELLQYSTAGSWRPKGSNLTVTGGVRLYEQSSTLNNANTSYTGANLGVNYVVNKWLRLFGSVAIDDSNGTQTVSSSTVGNLAAAAQHHFDPLELWGLNYTRFITASVSNSSSLSNESRPSTHTSSGSSSNSSQSGSVRLQHGLLGDNAFSFGGSTSLSQDLYMVTLSRNNPRVELNHTGTYIKGIRKSSLRLSGRDSRDLTGDRKFFQSLSLQGSQSESLSGTSTMSGNVTARAVRSGFDAGPGSTGTSLTSSATLSYRNLRTLGVRNLIFNSNLRLISSELSGGTVGVSENESQGQYLWDNRLRYQIGKLKLEGQALWEEVRSANIVRILFHARREF